MNAWSRPVRISLRTLLFSVVVLTLLVVALRGWHLVHSVRWIERVDAQQQTVGRMAATALRLLVGVQTAGLVPGTRSTARWERDGPSLKDDLSQLRAMDGIDSRAVDGFARALDEIEPLFGEWSAGGADAPSREPPDARLVLALHRLSEQALRYEVHIADLRREERTRQARWAIGFNILLVSLILLLAGLVVCRVLRPLSRLAATATRVQASGALDGRVRYRSDDEMGLATRSFDGMLDRLATMREELAQALAQQARERQELASIIEGTHVGTWAWNVATGETRFNERWFDIIGRHSGEMQPVDISTWANHTHPDDLRRSDERLQAHFRGESAFYECEVRMRHRDGHWVWVLDRGRVFTRTADGQPEWMYGTHQDISERKALEQTLADARSAAESASQAKSRFLATMSHELRTPLHAMLGMQRLLARDLEGPRERDLLRRAEQAGQALLAAVNDVLDLARIEAGEMALDPQPWRPRALADELLAVYGLQAQAKGLRLHSDLDPELPEWLLGDVHRVRQLLTNLLGNAIKFSEHGAIELRWRRHEAGMWPRLRISVIDSGIGIDEQRQLDLFAPFVQADPGVARRHGGSGLGLAIVRQFAELMGGEVGVRSKSGEGSTFWVDLPLVEPELAALRRPGVHPLQVALCSDRNGWRERWGGWVRSMGWSVHPGATPSDGAAADAPAADVLLVDGDADTAAAPPAALWVVLGGSQPGERPALRLPPDSDGSRLLGALAVALQATRVPVQRWVRAGDDGAPAARWLVGLRALVCDDNDTNRQIVFEMLGSQGASCAFSADGQQALDWLKAHPGSVDLVFMDLQMPVLDGLQACRQLRDAPATADMPVIALSASTLASERVAALAAGMNAFLGKPFDLLQLVHTVREQLPQAQAVALGADQQAPGAPAHHWPSLTAAETAPSPPPGAGGPGGVDGQDLGELLALLLRRDLDAVDWVLARGPALVRLLGAAQAHALRAAVEALDYERAVHLLGERSARAGQGA